MASSDYNEVLGDALLKLGAIVRKRQELEVEAAKLRQFIGATIHMLPDNDRTAFLKWYKDTVKAHEIRSAGLTDAIRDILYKRRKEWFSATEMRDALAAVAFDFSGYTSNPLASISSTLARLAPKEVECARPGGVAAYRWRNNKANRSRMKKRQEGAIEAIYGSGLVRLMGKPTEFEIGASENEAEK